MAEGAAPSAAQAPAAASPLVSFVANELRRPSFPEATAFAETLAARPGVVAVLFYGSCLQRRTTEGMLDFYALTDGSPGAWGESPVIRRAGHALPPNVYPVAWQGLKAKVAVVPLEEFRARMGLSTLDTTFWARFSQQAALLWVRDDATAAAVSAAIASGIETAATWAARLAPNESGTAAWRALFARTYRVEIRVEPRSRAADIVGADESRFETLWALSAPARKADAAAAPFGAWALRWWAGKALHLARLAKAAFTFDGGPRYLLWKIRRHMGR